MFVLDIYLYDVTEKTNVNAAFFFDELDDATNRYVDSDNLTAILGLCVFDASGAKDGSIVPYEYGRPGRYCFSAAAVRKLLAIPAERRRADVKFSFFEIDDVRVALSFPQGETQEDLVAKMSGA